MTKLIVTATSLNLRDKPSKQDSDIISILKYGDILDELESSSDPDWKKVRTATKKEGWASNKYLQPYSDSLFPWFDIAFEEYKKQIKEFEGAGDNPRIVEYLKSTNLDSLYASNDETPWCSAFVNWCIEQAKHVGTDSALARSWLKWGKEIDIPVKGCITILKRPPNPSHGHVAFFVSQSGDTVKLLGGNQKDAVNISEYSIEKVIGYRVPK